ncbi:hypothetical protein AVEN_4347-1, partial [Araneus ventricosus]
VSQVCKVKEFWFTLSLRFDIHHDDTKFYDLSSSQTPILDSPLVLHQGQKSCKEIAQITSIDLRTVQRIIKIWRGVNEPTFSRKMCGRKTILNKRDRK